MRTWRSRGSRSRGGIRSTICAGRATASTQITYSSSAPSNTPTSTTGSSAPRPRRRLVIADMVTPGRSSGRSTPRTAGSAWNASERPAVGTTPVVGRSAHNSPKAPNTPYDCLVTLTIASIVPCLPPRRDVGPIPRWAPANFALRFDELAALAPLVDGAARHAEALGDLDGSDRLVPGHPPSVDNLLTTVRICRHNVDMNPYTPCAVKL